MTFKKLIFRSTRGKAYVHFFNLEISQSDRMINVNDHLDRLVYIVVFEEGRYLKDKIKKICENSTDNMFEI